jgi:hypothetical protein
MIHDEVSHQVDVEPGTEGRDVHPATKSGVDSGVVNGVEAGVGAIDRVKKWQYVDPTEQPPEWALKQSVQGGETTATETIDVGNQLYMRTHGAHTAIDCMLM